MYNFLDFDDDKKIKYNSNDFIYKNYILIKNSPNIYNKIKKHLSKNHILKNNINQIHINNNHQYIFYNNFFIIITDERLPENLKSVYITSYNSMKIYVVDAQEPNLHNFKKPPDKFTIKYIFNSNNNFVNWDINQKIKTISLSPIIHEIQLNFQNKKYISEHLELSSEDLKFKLKKTSALKKIWSIYFSTFNNSFQINNNDYKFDVSSDSIKGTIPEQYFLPKFNLKFYHIQFDFFNYQPLDYNSKMNLQFDIYNQKFSITGYTVIESTRLTKDSNKNNTEIFLEPDTQSKTFYKLNLSKFDRYLNFQFNFKYCLSDADGLKLFYLDNNKIVVIFITNENKINISHQEIPSINFAQEALNFKFNLENRIIPEDLDIKFKYNKTSKTKNLDYLRQGNNISPVVQINFLFFNFNFESEFQLIKTKKIESVPVNPTPKSILTKCPSFQNENNIYCLKFTNINLIDKLILFHLANQKILIEYDITFIKIYIYSNSKNFYYSYIDKNFLIKLS